MCGIGALLDPGAAFTAAAAERMIGALRHRGPDGEGIADEGVAHLVHTRLAIVDPAGGAQPLRSEDGRTVAVVNGEIYNHLPLRKALEEHGHRFATASDCEVVVHGYEQWGTAVFERLNGIFALALWDGHARRLVLARDPLGVKPLYWWSDGRRVAAASEVRALLAAGVNPDGVDPVALDHFLAWRFVPAPRTLFAGIRKLPAASLLVATVGGPPRVSSYRRPPAAHFQDLDDNELAAELRNRFLDAVERQLMADVPVGALLSGGVDSAAVVAAIAARGGEPPRTFTIGFPGAGSGLDERAAAARTAALLGARHRSTTFSAESMRNGIDHAIRHLEEPCGIPSAPVLLELAAFARQEVKVVLAGQGADEPHGGYRRHQAALALATLARLPGPAARAARAGARLAARAPAVRRLAALAGVRPLPAAIARLVEISDAATRARLTGNLPDEAEVERAALVGEVAGDVGDRDALEQALYVDTHLWLPDHLLVANDKMTMASALELRVPYLDLELLRFVERIPARRRVRPRRGKHLHRLAVAGLLPAEIVERPKHGFTTPYEQWLRAELGAEVARRYRDGARAAELIDPGAVGKLVAEHRAGKANHAQLLYCLLELAAWFEAFVDPLPRDRELAADAAAQPRSAGTTRSDVAARGR